MRLALIPLNPTVGALRSNSDMIARAFADAGARGAALAVTPELCVCGYPPRDLLLAERFVESCERAALDAAKAAPPGLTVVIGSPRRTDRGVANALLVARDGTAIAWYDKRLLPTYDVFDEDRYFVPGETPLVVDVPAPGGVVRVGLAVCEDLWKGLDAGFASRYAHAPDPVADLVRAGARVIVSPSASPFVLGKHRAHREICAAHAARHGVVVASVNQAGANDDLVFDGHAMVLDTRGRLAAAGTLFEPAPLIAEVPLAEVPLAAAPVALPAEPDDLDLLFRALVSGVRDYLGKTGHRRAIIGLSGGIDSALTAVVAACALGGENVLGVSMPGPYSSEHSKTDAADLARRLGVRMLTAPIGDGVSGVAGVIDPALLALGQPALGRTLPDIAEENLQSRVRGTLLMGLSNRTGAMVLTTGNKSELAVGYCTLYGDMNGGLAVLSDISKTTVYRLARWINEHPRRCGLAGPPIPEGSITKPPSAELRPDQTDQDSLPPYDVLDEILARAVERRQAPGTIASETGFERTLVERVLLMVDRAEFKRRQAAVGLKVTTVAFGTGRRMPIAQGYRGPADA
ncbi:MAG: NAD+ synthase [Planctomycetota bacterium]|nr:NAD+ synthase [Planctomycetota bacterium]